ncbi:MAG TPA: hypothetical protein EYP67_01435 [Methanosarcinales archaeon]|nr:hypothetical protein [Methanosarcinales archaeon]
MKRILLAISLLILAMGSAAAADVAVVADLISQTPDPSRPGELVEIRLNVQNIGYDDAENVIIEVEPEYPFAQVPGESLSKTIPYLRSRQTDEDAAIIKLKLFVDKDAPKGVYELDIRIRDGTGTSSTKTVDIEVRGKEYAQIITISRANIDLAREEPLEFVITNTGNSPLKNMVFSWNDPDGVILPVYSDNTKYIKYLDVDESVEVGYTVIADINADPGLYQIDLNLKFEDYESNTSEISTTAGIFVGGETDFDVAFSGSSADETSFSIANIGSVSANSVTVSIPDQKRWKVSGIDSVIIGNLNTGDYTIASFNLRQEAGGALQRPSENNESSQAPPSLSANQPSALKIDISYTDTQGERHTITKEVDINPSTTASSSNGMVYGGRPRGAGASGAAMQKTATTVSWIGVGIIALAIFVVVHNRYKKERLNDPDYTYKKMAGDFFGKFKRKQMGK